jgi:ribosomal protein S18 acetylase RimI-like enzyme
MVEIKLLETRDYEKIADILLKSYVPQWQSAGTPVWNASYVEYLDKAYIGPDSIYVGAYDGDKLIAVGTGYFSDWNVSEVGDVKGLGICNLGVLPDYQRQGIATKIVEKLMDEAKSKKVHLIFRTCNQDLNDYKVLEKLGFEKKIDNVFQFARIMGKDMADFAAEIKEYGFVMKKMVKVVAGLPDEEKGIEEGKIREGNADDIKKCVEILNNYQSEADILEKVTEDDFKRNINSFSVLKDPFNPIFMVWDVDGKIKAFAIGRTELIRYRKGDANVNILIDIGFDQELSRKEKTTFAVSLLLYLKEKKPKCFATNGAKIHLENKALDKAGFNNDRSTRPLYALALSEDIQEWFQENWKYKNYYVPYQR